MSTKRRILPAAILMVAAGPLGGCAGDANPVRDLAVASGITGGEPKPAPDFISRTRSASVDYLPVGVSAPKPKTRAKSKADVAAAETDLNKTRSFNEARGQAIRRAAGAQTPAAPVKPPPPVPTE